MKPFLKYLTEDSKSTIDNNSKLIEKKLKAHGVDLQSGVPGSVHDYFNGVMGEAPEHHKLWIAKRYVSGGIGHTEDIPGTLNLLQRHDELLAQGNISGGMLPKLKTNAELYSFVNKNDPDKDVAVGNEKINSELVKPHEYTVTGENAHWTEITPHTENASCYFGKGSNWCTAPTGNNSSNLFKDYIKQGPTHILIPKAPRYQGEKYQVHAPTQQVTDETNTSVDISKIENHDGSDQLLKPEHHRPFPAGNINNYKETVQTHADARHVDPAVAMPALAHPNSDKTTAFYAVQNQNPKIALAGLRHSKADQLAIEEGVFHNSSEVALAAVNHPMANLSTIAIGAAHRSPVVVMAALKHPYFGSNSKTLSNAAKHLDPAVAMAALQHPKADKYTTSAAAEHPDPAVAMAALNHKDANKYTTHNAAKHKDPAVVMAALNHKDATSITISTAARHSDPAVAMAALNHKDADTETTINAAQHPDPAVAMAALQHKNATYKTAEIAIHHRDPAVKQAVLTYYDIFEPGADKNISNLSESYSAVKIKPFIRFLKEEDLTLEYHDTLNPKIWDGEDLKPEVQAKLLQIAKKWATFAKIPDFAVTDIILVGGNANYNWTKFSDLDLHLVVNREDLADCPDLLDDYLQNKKQLWALVHDITVYGHDVELYAQDKETPYPKKQGVYSVKGKKWIAQPKLEDVDFRGPALLAKVKQYTERIETLISTNAEDESFSKLKEKFKNMRSSGLKKIGEFSMENLVFKELRNRGVIDRMTKYLQSRLDQKLSLNEDYDFQIQIHNKKTNELVGVKQLSSQTKTDAMGTGLRGLQLAKHNFKSEYPAAGDVTDHQFSVRYPHDASWITPTS